MSVSKHDKKEQISRIIDILNQSYPDAHCSLYFTNPLELLFATLLSAQTTDVRVNIVTKELFRRYQNVRDYAEADIDEIAEIIRSIGCYRVKANNMVRCARQLCAQFDGQVPQTLDDLITLPGIGRKTANVVLSNGFNMPGFAVDTHVKRVSKRLGWTRQTDPVKIEAELCRYIEPDLWGHTSHLLIYHGRSVCKARAPQCSLCPVESLCKRVLKG